MFETLDTVRIKASSELDQSRRSEFGQYMTPSDIANFMASLFPKTDKPILLLEAGAGIGSLIVAFSEKILAYNCDNASVHTTAYEIDANLVKYLSKNLELYGRKFKEHDCHFSSEIIQKDFILDAKNLLSTKRFTHAILNPPYKKINSQSEHRMALREVGQEHVNLYSSFVGLSLALLEDGGQLVAIIPRSFCNGLYYKPFRKYILDNAVIKRMHLFESRTEAFKDDAVLQENVILHLEKSTNPTDVTLSVSNDSKMQDLLELQVPFSSIVKEGDKEYFFHIPNIRELPKEQNEKIRFSLEELGLQVSTGPVVDFRVKEFLRTEYVAGSMPLLYATHFSGNGIQWPKKSKKPNALFINDETIKASLPTGFYTVVKRFSSKEEKQRIVARVINPHLFKAHRYLGLENHLNYFHTGKKGIDENLAFGLAAYLNTSFVDTHFRSFNGHTQVNATDLRQMKYPSRETLIRIGKWAKDISEFTPEKLDEKVMQSI